MSETEFRVGKIKEICKEQETFEQKVNKLSEQTGISFEELTEDYEFGSKEMKWGGDYVYANKKLFKILKDSNIEEDQDLCEATVAEDGTIDYKLRYYNGGTCYNEMLEEALSKLD
jgi:hypothetical protein